MIRVQLTILQKISNAQLLVKLLMVYISLAVNIQLVPRSFYLWRNKNVPTVELKLKRIVCIIYHSRQYTITFNIILQKMIKIFTIQLLKTIQLQKYSIGMIILKSKRKRAEGESMIPVLP